MNKTIFIYAYTKLNLGDDLFIKILCDRYPKVKFFVQSSSRNAKGIRDIENLTIIPEIPYIDGLFRRLRVNFSINSLMSIVSSKICDGIVVIGGSIFMEKSNWTFQVKSFKKRLVSLKPFFILGANFGPYHNSGFRDEYEEIFKSVTDVCFREKFSYQEFKSVSNVRWESDVVFSLDTCAITSIKKNNFIKSERPYIVISMIELSNRKNLSKYKNDYIKKIVDLSNSFIDKGFNICCMSFCKSEGDSKAINEIIEMLGNEKKQYIKKYEYEGDIEEALCVIKNSTFLIGSRFHAMILGLVFRKPVYSLTYSNKSINVINDIGLYDYYAEIKNVQFLDVENVYKKLCKMPEISLRPHIDSANKQFFELDKLLLD